MIAERVNDGREKEREGMAVLYVIMRVYTCGRVSLFVI
jgi:hypothetical protein